VVYGPQILPSLSLTIHRFSEFGDEGIQMVPFRTGTCGSNVGS
jgi:hypothetical protein